ncbi:MAG: DUF1836 domain-containing protein [Bacillaceae bacterium]|nr:DUF1836 domain-containing protein [Bacillaceae bacterium]
MEIEKIIEEVGLDSKISLHEIPDIDLYMDQVIQLFESKFMHSKRNDDEKILTKTMINNYAKGELFFPIKNKKYSKAHIILISLIYQLKGTLSINDIKQTLELLNGKITEDHIDLEDFYSSYLRLCETGIKDVKEDVKNRVKDVEEEIITLKGETSDLKQVLTVASLINMSNSYRRIAERIVDQLSEDSKE